MRKLALMLLVFPAMVNAATYQSTVLSDTPVAYWRIGESSGTSATDLSGNSRTGTYSPNSGGAWTGGTLGVTGALTGDSNTAATFDGSTGFLNGTTLGSLGTNLAAGFTFECWIKTTSTASRCLWGGYDDGSFAMADEVRVNADANKAALTGGLYIHINDRWGTSLAGGVSSNTGITDGNWHHLVFTAKINTNTITIYVDGTAKTVAYLYQGTPSALLNYTQPRYVGANNSNGTPSSRFDGSMDEVAIYNSVLSSTRVSAHYAARNVIVPTVTVTGGGNSTYVTGTSNSITATSNDAVDGDITSGIGWTSNIQGGTLATGGILNSSTLNNGTHTLTLTSTNSNSNAGTATTTVTVIPYTMGTVYSPAVSTDGRELTFNVSGLVYSGISSIQAGHAITVNCTSQGYSNTGVLGTTNRTLMPCSFKTAATGTGYATITLYLGETIHQGDGSTVTLNIPAGSISDGTNSNLVASNVSVTNNSTLAYPKVIVRWATVPYQIVSGSVLLEASAACKRYEYAASATPGDYGIACLIFTATDGTHTVTSTVTDRTLTDAIASASPAYSHMKALSYYLYRTTPSLSGFSGTLTCSLACYPKVGNASSVRDSTDSTVGTLTMSLGTPAEYWVDSTYNATVNSTTGFVVGEYLSASGGGTGAVAEIISPTSMRITRAGATTIGNGETLTGATSGSTATTSGAPAARGSDSNAGTELSPFATYSKAVSLLTNGGTIHLQSGKRQMLRGDNVGYTRSYWITTIPTEGTYADTEIVLSESASAVVSKQHFMNMTFKGINALEGYSTAHNMGARLWIDGCYAVGTSKTDSWFVFDNFDVANYSSGGSMWSTLFNLQYAHIFSRDTYVTGGCGDLWGGSASNGGNTYVGNVVADVLDPVATGHHLDVFQATELSDGPTNTILENFYSDQLHYQSLFLATQIVPTVQANMAIINCFFKAEDPIRAPNTECGFFVAKPFDNLLVWNSSFLPSTGGTTHRISWNDYTVSAVVHTSFQPNTQILGCVFHAQNDYTVGAWIPRDCQFQHMHYVSASGAPYGRDVTTGSAGLDAYGKPQSTSALAHRFSTPIKGDLSGAPRNTATLSAVGAYEYSAPPTATITGPLAGSIYLHGASVTLTGSGTDPEDVIFANQLSWSSSIDGVLGTGTSITRSNLSYGRHTVTLTVTANSGLTATATVVLYVNSIALAIPDYYVDSVGGNDANDGLSWATAEKTIGAAVVDAGTAGGTKVIGVASGTYNAEASGRVSFDSVQSGDTITVEKYLGYDGDGTSGPADGPCSFTSTNFNALWFKTTCVAGTFVWDGIDVSTTDVNQMVNLDNTTLTGTLFVTIKNCTLGGWTYLVGTAGGTYKDITLDTVVFSPPGALGWFLSNSARHIKFIRCSGAFGSTVPVAPVIQVGAAASATLTDAVFDQCNFTSQYYSYTYEMIRSQTLTTGAIDIHGCTFDTRAALIHVVGTATGSPVLKCYDNTIMTTADGTANHDLYAILVGDSDDTVTTTCRGPVIRGNRIFMDGARTGHSIGIFAGKGVTGGAIVGNVLYGPGMDQGIFLESQYTAVVGNSVSNYNGGDCIIAEESLGNQIIRNSVYADSAETQGFAICFRDGTNNSKQALGNIVLENVIHAGGDSTNAYGLSAHTGTMTVSSNIFDWNVYYLDGSGSGGLGRIDSTQSDSRAPLAFLNWSAYTLGTQFNDAGSVIAHPGYRSALTGDLRLPLGSAAKGSQLSTSTPSLWNDRGAWQRKAGSGSTRR